MEKPICKIEIVHNQIDTAIAIIREVAAWGRGKGYRVWLDEWLTKDELLSEDVTPEDFCVGRIDGEDACAFILQRRDSEYWEGARSGEAVYLHKFCVRRKFAHMGMTGLVAAAIRENCRAQGIKYIRLDTGLDEKVVRQIYLNAGFKIVRIIDHENGHATALYEMEVI